jgi:membrane carboxypeptidase/penicillin-binding protein PbpC
MKSVERLTVPACCGKPQVIFRTSEPIAQSLLEALVSNGFTDAPNFLQAGILYADNSDLIVTGPIGSNRLQAKCKKADCEQIFNDFEALLLKLG